MGAKQWCQQDAHIKGCIWGCQDSAVFTCKHTHTNHLRQSQNGAFWRFQCALLLHPHCNAFYSPSTLPSSPFPPSFFVDMPPERRMLGHWSSGRRCGLRVTPVASNPSLRQQCIFSTKSRSFALVPIESKLGTTVQASWFRLWNHARTKCIPCKWQNPWWLPTGDRNIAFTLESH